MEDNNNKKNERNAKRRLAYAQMDSTKKQDLLKRRREKYALKKSRLNATPTVEGESSNHEVGQHSSFVSIPTIHTNPFVTPSVEPTVDTNALVTPSFQPVIPTAASVNMCRHAHIDHSLYPAKKNRGEMLIEQSSSYPTPNNKRIVISPILPHADACEYCNAKRFYLEPPSFCCSEGEIKLALPKMLPRLATLFTAQTPEALEFKKYIRSYNNNLAFTTFSAKTDADLLKNTQGVYTFKVQGKVYHYLNGIYEDGDTPTKLQLYFYDTNVELEYRLKSSARFKDSIMMQLMDILSENPYTVFLKQAREMEKIDDHKLCLINSPKLDQRVYNHPTCEDVAAIISLEDENEFNPQCHIQIYNKLSMPHKISHNFGCYDPLQYPLLFPSGNPGWHYGIEKLPKNMRKRRYTCNTPLPDMDTTIRTVTQLISAEEEAILEGLRKRNIVSCRQYYCYKLQMRNNDESMLLHGGRLFQQYIVDMFVKVETSRLEYLNQKQKEIRTEYLQGIVDSIASGNTTGSSVGRKIILPPSFMGGPRDMRKRYLDAMALVQQFGKPDFFITMTCNSSWSEITDHLLTGELPQNRPDLLARVFRSKFEVLKKDLLKTHVLGIPCASVYSIEFQKRGLPHAHLLLIMNKESKPLNPEAYDRIITAELPDPDLDPELYALVRKHMMHGPCGHLNGKSPCMNNGKCKNKYPRDFLDYTTHGNDSYPCYRRRNTGICARVRGQTLDNRWVVPYNPYFLRKYDCHINVEICSTIKLVKYIYKYIYKGPDKIAFQITTTDTMNEIQEYQKGRWVSPPEAAWRLYSFPLFEMHPAVVSLQVHLPNNYPISFSAHQDLNSLLNNEFLSRTMLTQFFYMNKCNDRAKKIHILYKEFPKYFVWDGGKRQWNERKKGKVVGRVVTVSPTEGERYYLRLLLNHVKGPTCFEDLLTANGHKHNTFRESALHRNLLASDYDIDNFLEEASVYQMPKQFRHLFSSMLVYCSPNNPKKLWEKYSKSLSEDYINLQPISSLSNTEILIKVLEELSILLENMGKKLSDFNLCDEATMVSKNVNLSKEIAYEQSLPVDECDLLSVTKLNEKQRYAYDMIIKKTLSNEPAAFFIDGPGGTGKTYLYKALLATLRSQGYIAIATATSGVAASILLGGRTAHSRFKLPLHNETTRTTNVSKQSSIAKLILKAKIIIWDEAPMAHRKSIEAFSNMLKDITEQDKPFGDKVIVFGGDFRQVLPVVQNATKHEQLDSSLINSPLWPYFTRISLTKNMRASTDPFFVDFLLRIGNGTEPQDEDGNIFLPTNMLIPHTDREHSLRQLMDFVYPDLTSFKIDPFRVMSRALLSPTNDCVDDINESMLHQMPGTATTYISTDIALDPQYQGDYEDFLNSLHPSSLPLHELVLKPFCPIILLRNLNPTEGFCNGTRLICKELKNHTILAEIACGPFTGKSTILHKIPLETSNDDKIAVPFKRYQFPIRLCFAMTINKAQGQTLDRVGIYLREPVFSHGQLYVALSRAKKSNDIKILITPPTFNETITKNKTRNVVYQEILNSTATQADNIDPT